MKPRICLLMHWSPLRDLFSEILSQENASYEATGVDSVREGARPPPDLVVLDLGCGAAIDDSLSVIRALKAADGLRSVPVLAITTDIGAARERRTELKELHARLLPLPVDLETLEARVASLVAAGASQ